MSERENEEERERARLREGERVRVGPEEASIVSDVCMALTARRRV